MTQQNNNAEQYATVRLQSGGSFSRGEQEEEEEEEASGREWQPLGQAPMDKKLTQWLIAALCCGLFVYLLYGTVYLLEDTRDSLSYFNSLSLLVQLSLSHT